MADSDTVIYEFDSAHGHYQVVDMVYDGRPARVLFSGDRLAAQSGVAYDDRPDMLFDYNQRLYELAIGTKPTNVLILGGGMFTLPMGLAYALPNTTVDVVEIDEALTAVARDYFNLQSQTNLNIINDDALAFLTNNTVQYDMIIVDAYRHASAEPTLGELSALQDLSRTLTTHGILAANVIAAYHGTRSQPLHALADRHRRYFDAVNLYPASAGLSLWLPQNIVLTASHVPNSADLHLRHGQLAPDNQPFNVGHDLR